MKTGGKLRSLERKKKIAPGVVPILALAIFGGVIFLLVNVRGRKKQGSRRCRAGCPVLVKM